MRLTVVLIDDDPDDLELMQDAINEVVPLALCIPFSHPAKAIKALVDRIGSFAPDHIFLDHNMPEMMGIECLKVLRSMKELDNTAISIVSTSMDELDSKLFTSFGADFTFRKPNSVKEYNKLLRIVFGLG
ncbi:MAG: response regulator [Chryseolinea sp.]